MDNASGHDANVFGDGSVPSTARCWVCAHCGHLTTGALTAPGEYICPQCDHQGVDEACPYTYRWCAWWSGEECLAGTGCMHMG